MKRAASVVRRGLALVALAAVASCAHARPSPLYPPGPLSCAPSGSDGEHPCVACLKTSCCAEAKACDAESFPTDSPGRAEASRSRCLVLCQEEAHRPLPDCLQRCGGPVTEASKALASCWEDHCGAACAKEGPR